MGSILDFLHNAWSILGKVLAVHMAIMKGLPHLFVGAIPIIAFGFYRLTRMLMENLDSLAIVKDQIDGSPELDIIVPTWASMPLALMSPYIDFSAFILAAGTILTVWVVTATYRLVKSWIPTVSG